MSEPKSKRKRCMHKNFEYVPGYPEEDCDLKFEIFRRCIDCKKNFGFRFVDMYEIEQEMMEFLYKRYAKST